MNGACDALDTLKADTEYTDLAAMHLANKNISNADVMIYFVNADTLNLNHNQLTSFPTDISRFKSLTRLQLSFNQLTKAPDINYTNVHTGDTAVKLVYLQFNQIKELPASWYDYNMRTQVIDLRGNELDTIPDFNNYTQIRRLDLRENHLQFKDLIPVMDAPTYGVEQYDFFPQKEFEIEIDTLVKIGDTLRFNISRGLVTNSYRMLKDNGSLEDNKTGEFELIIESEDELGEYWFKIFNENFPESSDFLQSQKYNLVLDTSMSVPNIPPTDPDEEEDGEPENPTSGFVPNTHKDVWVFSPDGDGVDDYVSFQNEGVITILNKHGQVLRTENSPYDWYGDDSSGEVQSPGLYIIDYGNDTFEKVLIVR